MSKVSVPREGKPAFWTTSIAKDLTGDQPCQLSTWLGGHFKLVKRPRADEGSLAAWKANHTAQLQEAIEKFKADGWKCSVERFFKVEGHTSIISGKADLIAQKPNHRPRIVDIKSGSPRDSDVMQVIVEMVMIPLAWEAPSMVFDGQVIYSTHDVMITPAEADLVRPKVFAALKRLGSGGRPDAAPNESACRFCDVSDADCALRVGAETVVAQTELF